jgi:crotonobetainyl-CoA:carnitine CoA-transferase CaiB-like acyl-CoA transferase
VTADLKTGEGRDVFKGLVRRADVLLENFRPGVLDRLGFDLRHLQELNPRLVILSITGFGHDGPEAARAGYDQIAQGEAGLMSMTGPPGEPTRVGLPIGDLLAGMYGAFGVLAALLDRERTGRGTVVRTSLLAAIVGVHSFQGTRWTVAHQVPEGPGNHHPSIAPYGLFHAADGPIQIAVGSEAQWRVLAPAVGLDPADPRYATNRDRVAHRESLLAAIDSALAAESSATWLERLDKLGVPAGRVRSLDQVYGWEQTRSQGLMITVDHPVLGRIELPGPPLRFDDQLFAGGRGAHLPPPTLGQHDDEVRAWLAGPE